MERTRKPVTVRVGVDTGGTFTDFVVWRDGRLFNRKVLSTPQDPSLAIFEGVGDILKDSPAVFIVHGTTVATNALLQQKGRPHRPDHHGRIRGRPGHRPADAAEPVLPPAREPVRAHPGRAPVRSPREDARLGRDREARQGDRGPPAHPEDQARRAPRPSPSASSIPTPIRPTRRSSPRELGTAGLLVHRLEPSPSRVPRVRADLDDRGQRLSHAGHGPLPRRARPPHRRGRPADHAVERGLHLPGPGPRRAHPHGPLRSGRRRRRRPRPGPERPASPTSSASTWAARRPTSRSSRAASGGPTRAGSATSPSACPSSTSIRSGPAAARSPTPTGAARSASAPRAPAPIPGPACYGRGDLPTVTDANLVPRAASIRISSWADG